MDEVCVTCVAPLLTNRRWVYRVHGAGRGADQRQSRLLGCGTYRIQQLKDELAEVVADMEHMDTADDSKNHTRTKQMSIGRKKFNMDPKKGIEFLTEHGLLQATSEDVAAFLYKGEGLNKTAIGDYLGERSDFNEKVLKAFVALHDFTDLILVQALRQFLWSFRLPGKAQKIDRMMECFAQRYCHLNPNIFTNTDTCYVLSFAIIMLNTSLHNPSVKDKPTVEQFISMNRGINNGGDLPRELLVQLKDELAEVVADMEHMDTADDSKNHTRTKQMSIGRKKFNMDPKKGIEFLTEHGLLQATSEDVAAFLYKGEGLNKTAIGDYLGERSDFNEKVLKAFVALHDFTDLILVQALRQFLWSFRLPGKAQKIDRMMECFAQRYCHLNPNIFTNTDTCYVLSFAIIMLNTSLHNPSVKDKPTVEQFISMNRGINNGGDLPRELLVQLKDELAEVVADMEHMDTADDSKNHTRTKQMSIGRKKFNMDPKKGIEFLTEHGLLQATSEDVAAFLYKGEGLNKTAIGDYLGERSDFNEKVLKAFVALHDFTDLILVQALRQFLWSFRLPGKAQKIDRMMECFAQRYCHLNPNIFTNTDTCYVLSFAIIMLNTSLHNPSVKDKPTVEQFISMNRGINNGGDLPRELLVQLKDELAEVVADMEHMDTADDSKNHTRTKQMSIGRKKFNMDPKKGIEFLTEHGLLQATSEDVAAFLYKGEGLNKTAIGDYLGERSDFNEKVLKAFVALHDFTDLILVQALRQFLWSFRLPGEAQKIDRMMECFAQRYCHLNPNIFTNTDTCYVLSFAIIMLNTSLHNPSVKDKPTVEQFISMNRGINNGGDLPRELLVSLYDSIKMEPFKIPEDDGNDLMHTFFNPDKEGWLWKQGGRYKSWKRRWFILNDNCLYYFEYTTDKEPRGIIPLENIQVREATDRHKPYCLELYALGTDFIKACKTDSEGKVVEGKHTVYRMSASTAEEREDWIKCIRQSISHNPFYDMLAARKKKAQKNSSNHAKS